MCPNAVCRICPNVVCRMWPSVYVECVPMLFVDFIVIKTSSMIFFSLLAANGVTSDNKKPTESEGLAATSLAVLEGSISNMRSVGRNTGWRLFFQKWRAMFTKRLLHSMRYKRAIVTQLILPGFWTLMAMIVAKTFPQPTDSPALTMNANMFKTNYVPFSDPGKYVLLPSNLA